MSNRVCSECGRKMKQQFIGLLHCKCGVSWINGEYFKRTGDMKFCLQRKKVGKKIKQVPVIRYFSDEVKEEERRGENLYFAVYSLQEEEFQHKILYRKSKKIVAHELRNKGYTVHYVFNKNNVEAIKNGHFSSTDVRKEVVAYFVKHIDEWDLNF